MTCPIFFLVSGKKTRLTEENDFRCFKHPLPNKDVAGVLQHYKKIVYIIHFESKQKYPPQESDIKSGNAE